MIFHPCVRRCGHLVTAPGNRCWRCASGTFALYVPTPDDTPTPKPVVKPKRPARVHNRRADSAGDEMTEAELDAMIAERRATMPARAERVPGGEPVAVERGRATKRGK